MLTTSAQGRGLSLWAARTKGRKFAAVNCLQWPRGKARTRQSQGMAFELASLYLLDAQDLDFFVFKGLDDVV